MANPNDSDYGGNSQYDSSPKSINAGDPKGKSISSGSANGSPGGMSDDDMQPPEMKVAGSKASDESILPKNFPANGTEGVPGNKDAGKSLDSLWAKSAGSC